ncbi:hypothetical protein F751_3285 [Auxenochlorella protothecoides]|uniref:Uncharacterized protein n=1 Tax=Auxenochlorella protothecoides TaxID=3075 RepID=A0A087SRX4_AUXPR|nr:hypothetical protein F751_3285 [Auxenochlorella protothecoides]KFM28478.1 hypothetical protein F751_3285 [Auxenochlorella protothecoides]
MASVRASTPADRATMAPARPASSGPANPSPFSSTNARPARVASTKSGSHAPGICSTEGATLALPRAASKVPARLP